MLTKFAQELKKAREKAEVTLQNLSARSRLDIKFLQAMENGDFSFLPEIYVKAFIKDYAKFIGLDENEIIKKYEAAKKGKDYNKLEEKENKEVEKDQNEKVKDKKEKLFEDQKKSPNKIKTKSSYGLSLDKKNVKIFAIIGCVLIIIIVAIIIFTSDNTPEIIVQEKPYDQVRNETQKRYIENKQTIPVKTKEDLSLQIFAEDTSWIKVKSDKAAPKEFTIFPGTSVNLNSKEKFVMTIGNSGGITMNLNGKKLDFVGQDKQIKHVMITKEGINYLNTEPTFKNN
ncbi:MAG: hypothetical protein COW08_04120 [Ignavibacteriales bacterium CG12_big_fil_rev_8_21_14_0_65_30_8]|nr:MAG: hypothetical protein COW08_04120 [Ignavibacteriales bacterium CG12_big_fil_rev_8_21_14_0_65_30_8]